jgi:hypothetical protein
MLALILGVWLYQFAMESRWRLVLKTAPVRLGLAVGMLLYLAVFASGDGRPFIYFQF